MESEIAGGTLKILVIEDEDRSLRQTMSSINEVFGTTEVSVARSLSEALQLITEDFFDLALCDLKIPTVLEALDSNEDHGRAAYAALREHCPGTPVIFLTARATTRNTSRELASGGLGIAFGIENFLMTQLAHKGDPDEIESLFREIADGIVGLDSCVVESSNLLDPMFARAVQTYGFIMNSRSAKVSMTNGLSGSRVGIVEFDNSPNPPSTVVVKLDSSARVFAESQNYHRFVNGLLPAGSFAAQFRVIETGLRGMSASFSTVASATSQTYFVKLGSMPTLDVVPQLINCLGRWAPSVSIERISLGDLRALAIHDPGFRSLSTFTESLTRHDQLEFELATKITHGDLHGDNILIDAAGRAILIDFADTAVRFASSDPVALELSLVAHPNAPFCDAWPTDDQLTQWTKLDRYAKGSPFAALLHSCRSWGEDDSNRDQFLAVAYVQACWLMKHGGSAALRMSIIAESIMSELDERAHG